MTEKPSGTTYVLVVSSGAGWNEDLVALLKKSCPEPIRREHLFVSAGVPQAGGQGGGVAFDMKDVITLGIWAFGGLSVAMRTPEAMKILEELVKGVDTAQIAIIWTTRSELVDHVVAFGKRCACEVKKAILPHAEADMMKPGQVAQGQGGLGSAGTVPQAGRADLRSPEVLQSQKEVSRQMGRRATALKASDSAKASASRKAVQKIEKIALKRLGRRQQLIVT
jgi:hypothetical protein